jgi:hypothetical protein
MQIFELLGPCPQEPSEATLQTTLVQACEKTRSWTPMVALGSSCGGGKGCGQTYLEFSSSRAVVLGVDDGCVLGMSAGVLAKSMTRPR